MVFINNLVKKARKGDEKAFLTLFQHYEEDIYRIAYVYVKNKNDALDIVQETAYKAISQIQTLKNPEYFKTWLIRITINCAINLVKKEKKIVPFKSEYTEYNISNANDCALRLTLRDLIERLNENEKSVVVLKYFYNYTFSEISKIVDLPMGTVKSLLYRSLEKLRIQLNKEDIYEQ